MKKPRTRWVRSWERKKAFVRAQAANLLICLESRESLRDMVLRLTTPLPAPRIICGSATRSAASAADLFPAVIAASTLRMDDLRALRRRMFASVRRFVWRILFLAERLTAISKKPFIYLDL